MQDTAHPPCSHPSDYQDILYEDDDDGPATWPAKTVIEVFQNTVERFPDHLALCYKRPLNGTLPEEYTKLTYREYWHACMLFAKALIKLDVQCFDIVNILGFNSHEWFIANNGAILAGAIAAGIYTTNGPDACHYISNHSRAKIVVVDGNKQLDKYTKMSATLPHLKTIVIWGEAPDAAIVARCPVPVVTWEAFLQSAISLPDRDVDARWANIRPGNCCTLIYTSGTTGHPKAVMISHDNITWTARNVCDGYMILGAEDRVVSFLPLSHVAAQLIDIHCCLLIGGSVWFAQPDALKGSLAKTMKEVRPTFLFGVPRVWEKIKESMERRYKQQNCFQRLALKYAQMIGRRKADRQQFTGDGQLPWCFTCANILVFHRIKEAVGLDQCKGCFTAAAPIAPETLWYFASLDIPVFEVFGQSECTGPHTVSFGKSWKIGSCGRPLAGTSTRIEPITKELCYRGRHIFMGYMYNEPDTTQSFDSLGFLHSGDIAHIDDDGFVYIIGRIKDLIVTAGGENVAPTLLESNMMEEVPELSHCLVVGDKRKFLSALLTLRVEIEKSGGKTEYVLSKDSINRSKILGSIAESYRQVREDPAWRKYIDDGIERANKRAPSTAQHIRRWAWLPEDLSERHGEITPTLKIKRTVVLQKYADLIDSLYAST